MLLIYAFLSCIICSIQLQSASSYQITNDAFLPASVPSYQTSNVLARLLSNHMSSRDIQAFSTLNNIFSKVTLLLPDSSISSSGLDLTITELTCSGISVQDIQVGHTFLSTTTTRLAVNVIGLEVTCNFRWSYKWTIFSGSGSGKALLDSASWASINFDFVSQDYNQYPPKDVNINDCNAAVEIGDLEFDGDGLGFIASIINAFERLLRDRIEGEVDTAVCSELKVLGDGALDDLLLKLSAQLDGYIEPLPGDKSNPLLLEASIDIPRDENGTLLYLNFLELQEYAGDWIKNALDKIDSYLGGSENSGELGINSFIRDNFLNHDGEFVVNPSDFMTSNVIFESHDMLTETSMSIESIAVRGLDTLTELDLMNAIGNHTLKNNLKMESLSLVVGMKAYMKASSQSNAIISAPNSDPIEENFSVTVVLEDIEISFSFLLAMNTETLGNMQLGQLLSTETIMQCIMGAAEQLVFTELSVSVLDVVPPTLTGFLDAGIDKIVSKGAAALFDMYESVLLKAMPNFFHIFVREKLNTFIKNSLQLFTVCANDQPEIAGLIDYRDLLLTPEKASAQGGSGRSPYGNVVNFVWELVQDHLFVADEYGLLAVNDILVGPLTKSQSGQEGLFSFNQTFVELRKDYVNMDIWRAFAEHLDLSISNLRLSGIDTFRIPFHVIRPSNGTGNVLQNHISLGTEETPLDATFQFGIELGGVKSPLATRNVLDLQLTIPSIEILADVFVAVDGSKFMNIPLKNLLNTDCWLSMMMLTDEPMLDTSMRTSTFVGLALQQFEALLDDFTAQSSCVSCSNQALKSFNLMLEFLDKNDFFSTVKSRSISILNEILESEYFGDVVGNAVQSAAMRCDSRNRVPYNQIDEIQVPFISSKELVDGVLYAAMGVSQIIAVVLAQKHLDPEITYDDVLIDVPTSNANLIDLTNLTSIANWAGTVLDEVSTYLGSLQQNDNGEEVLGIVSVFQSLVLDGSGLLTIPMIDQGFEAGGVILSVYNLTLEGLDSFTIFDIFNIKSSNTFSNKARLDSLGISVNMGLSTGGSELETITASLLLKEIDVDVSLWMAIDQEILGDLTLGSMMDTSHIFFCILTAIQTIGLSEFLMSIRDIENFSLTGFIAEETDDSIKRFTDAVFAEYKDLVLGAIPAFTFKTVRPLLHNIIQVMIDMAKGGSCPALNASDGDLIDFRDLFLSSTRSKKLLGSGDSPYGNLFQILYNFIERIAEQKDGNGLSMMNDALVSRITDDGDLFWDGDVFSRDIDISLNGLNADILVAIKDVKIENLDSIGFPVGILKPLHGERSVLDNSVSVGVGNPLRVSFTLFVSGKGDEIQVKNELELGLSLSTADVLLKLLAAIKETSLMNFPLRDLTNINCWLATIVTPILDQYGSRIGEKTMALETVTMAVAEAQLDINCISCTSPVLLEMSSFFSSDKGVDDTTQVANMILEYGSRLLMGDYVQNILDKLINEATLKCPHSNSYNPNINGIKYEDIKTKTTMESSYTFLWAILSVALVISVLSACIVFAVKFMKKKRHTQWMQKLTPSQLMQIAEEEKYEAARQEDINRRMAALAFSNDSVPLVLRLGMPVIILGNISLFLSGHLSLGGTVNISGQFAGQYFDVEGFFEFSMVNSTIEMWDAGAHSLAILIVIFSGLWPYSKQLIILVIWFLPTSRLSTKRRGKLLHWLDVLGKWSMVDVFVLLMSIASFRITLDSPTHLEFLPEGLFSLNMMVVPLWGLYANMLAQIVSQISSHVIIHYHRKTEMVATQSQAVEWGIESASDEKITGVLNRHQFKLDYEASTKYATIRKGVSSVLAVLLSAFTILVICGCSMTSFSIETVGLLGLAVESMNEFKDAISYYSVFELANMMMNQARYLNTPSNYIGLGTLSTLLVVTVFIIPAAQGTCLLIEWFRPMNKNQRKRYFVIIETLSAWQYMEVYVLSVVIAAWQLGGVSEYMINEYCSSLEYLFNTLSFYGILNEKDAQCFRVNAQVETATYLLVVAAVILNVTNNFIMSASAQREQDICTLSDKRMYSDRFLSEKATMSLDEDVDEYVQSGYGICITPLSSRFTDLYPFVTLQTEKVDDINSALPAVATDSISNSPSNPPIEIETAKTFWDVPLDNSVTENQTANADTVTL